MIKERGKKKSKPNPSARGVEDQSTSQSGNENVASPPKRTPKKLNNKVKESSTARAPIEKRSSHKNVKTQTEVNCTYGKYCPSHAEKTALHDLAEILDNADHDILKTVESLILKLHVKYASYQRTEHSSPNHRRSMPNVPGAT